MKRILCTTLVVILLFCLCACNVPQLPEASPEASIEIIPTEETSGSAPETTPGTMPETSPSAAPEVSAAPSSEPTPSESSTPETESGVYVDIFHGDENAEKLLSESRLLKELSPQDILDALTDIGVFSDVVTANSFTIDNYNVIHLDLDEAFSRQISAMGTSGEYIMMGSLVNSFIKAFEADGMSITVNGSVLETGHNIYDFTLSFFEN